MRKVLDVKYAAGLSIRLFWLVESRAGPSSNYDQPFKVELTEDESFETDFIGASLQDCQNWLIEQQRKHNFIEQNILAIVDARSAQDGTILMSHFYPKMDPPLEFGRYGELPKEGDTWYDYRIEYERAADLDAALTTTAPDCTYPVYFGLKEELTDEHGVFDVARATRLSSGEEARPSMY